MNIKNFVVGLALMIMLSFSVAHADIILQTTPDSSSGMIVYESNISTTGNVSASYFLGDGSLLTNLPGTTSYWNRTGTMLEPATLGDIINTTGDYYGNDYFSSGNFQLETGYAFKFNDTIWMRINTLSTPYMQFNFGDLDTYFTSGDTYFDGNDVYVGDGGYLYVSEDEAVCLDSTCNSYIGEFNTNVDIGGYNGNITLGTGEGFVIPYVDDTETLGSSSNRFKDLYLSGTQYLPSDVPAFDFSGSQIMYNTTAGTLQFGVTPEFMYDVYVNPDRYLSLDGSNQNNIIVYYSVSNQLAIYSNGTLVLDAEDTLTKDVYPMTTETYNLGNGTLRWNNTNTKNAFIGNSTGNISGTPTGITFSGTARVMKSVWSKAYTIYPYAGTYNGVSCTDTAALSILNATWLVRAIDDGPTCESVVVTMEMPEDYEAGTPIIVSIDWSAASTSGNVVWGAGVNAVGAGESYVGSGLWNTTTTTVSGTQYGKTVSQIRLAGTGMQPSDDLGVVVYRDGGNAADTMSGDALMAMVEIYYTSNVFGSSSLPV